MPDKRITMNSMYLWNRLSPLWVSLHNMSHPDINGLHYYTNTSLSSGKLSFANGSSATNTCTPPTICYKKFTPNFKPLSIKSYTMHSKIPTFKTWWQLSIQPPLWPNPSANFGSGSITATTTCTLTTRLLNCEQSYAQRTSANTS